MTVSQKQILLRFGRSFGYLIMNLISVNENLLVLGILIMGR